MAPMIRLPAICACFLGLGVALASGEATAQSTSTCVVVGPNLVHCDTIDPGPPPGSSADAQSGGDSGVVLGKALRNLLFGDREKAFRIKIGKMLADGDCQGAARMAFESGRLELGQSIVQSCRSGAPPATGPAS